MKIKLDENLPHALVTVLQEYGHDVDTVQSEGLVGEADFRVWDAAQKQERFLITQDLDFSDVRQFAPGTHAGILLIRLREPGRLALRNKVQILLQAHDLAGWSGAFVVVTDHKLRIRP